MSFFQAFIYLLATVISVPIAKRLGLGSVLGYLLAGMVIGPFGLRLIGTEGGGVMHFAEFGVVMMLFLVGLELRPALLWQLRGPILGLGAAQVIGTAGAAGALVGLALRLPWQMAAGIGFIVAMSSTAIVLQSLHERGLIKTPGGEASFSVLLFQDIAVIPILAFLPLLATLGVAPEAVTEGGAAAASLPGWQRGIFVLGAVGAVVLGGRFLLRPIFRYIAATQLREIFTALALLLVVGIALLMQKVGLSAGLGTFLAGVVLAESEYRHQLEADIEPFKGLLLGLFFLSVGASIDFALIAHRPATVALFVVGLLAVKFGVLVVMSRLFKLETSQALLFGFALAQGGEFAFVLISFAQGNGVLTPELAKLLAATIAASMAFAPLLFLCHERFVQPLFSRQQAKRAADVIEEHDNPVILAGFGRFGHIVGRLLRANGFGTTVLDHDADWVDTLRRLGQKAFYGDATRLDLLRTAGVGQARLFIVAIANEKKSLQLVRMLQEHFPKLHILARGKSRQHAYELINAGVADVYRETLGSSLDLSVDALRALGMECEEARRSAEIFREYDESSVRELAALVGDDRAYFSRARLHIENLENVLHADRVRSLKEKEGRQRAGGE